ncbi:MAG: glycosyltransferase family 4 protein [Gaiellaceae bacterium]
METTVGRSPPPAAAARADRNGRARVFVLVTLGEVGGAQGYVASLLPALAGEYDVVVGAHGGAFVREAAERSGIEFVHLEQLRRPISPWRDLRSFAELYRLLRRQRPDVLHASSSKAGVIGRLAAVAARVPVRVFTVHGWAFSAHSGAASALYRWADRIAGRATTATICVSQRERADGLRARTCRADRTVVIPNGVEVDAYPQASLESAVPRLIAVGRLAAPKDWSTLLSALTSLDSEAFTELAIVGDGPERERVEDELARRSLEGRVRLLGERDDVPRLLAEADVFLLASRSEGLPLSVIEAMAAGLPIVASDVGGLKELVRDGETGVLVPPGDPVALAEALRPLLANRELRRRLGRAGRARAKALFDLSGFRRAHLELYRRELAAAGVSSSPPKRERR